MPVHLQARASGHPRSRGTPSDTTQLMKCGQVHCLVGAMNCDGRLIMAVKVTMRWHGMSFRWKF